MRLLFWRRLEIFGKIGKIWKCAYTLPPSLDFSDEVHSVHLISSLVLYKYYNINYNKNQIRPLCSCAFTSGTRISKFYFVLTPDELVIKNSKSA